MAQKLPIAVAL